MDLRRMWNTLPSCMITDNAIFTANSVTRKYLLDGGVRLLHGLPHVSRSQSKAEKCIGTISRLTYKYHTAHPSMPFPKLVAEAVFTYNNSKHTAHGQTPRSLHFANPPSPLMNVASEAGSGSGGSTGSGSGSGAGSGRGGGLKSAREAVALAREAKEGALLENVKCFLKRKQTRSPTDFGRRLKVGDLVLRKRTRSVSDHVYE